MLVLAAHARPPAAVAATASAAGSQSIQQLAGLFVTMHGWAAGWRPTGAPHLVGSGGGKVGAPGKQLHCHYGARLHMACMHHAACKANQKGKAGEHR